MSLRALTFFGPALALASAALFGASTPLAKLLLGEMDPWLLAGLLYLGSGLGLVHLGRRSLGIEPPEAPLRRADLPWLAAVILSCGVIGPVLLMLSLSFTPASSAALLLNVEGLDLYAHLLHRISPDRPLTLSWRALQAQLGTSESMTNSLAKRIRDVLPDVLTAYPDARVEATRRDLVMGHSSPSAPPRTSVLLGAARSGTLKLLPGGA